MQDPTQCQRLFCLWLHQKAGNGVWRSSFEEFLVRHDLSATDSVNEKAFGCRERQNLISKEAKIDGKLDISGAKRSGDGTETAMANGGIKERRNGRKD